MKNEGALIPFIFIATFIFIVALTFMNAGLFGSD